MRSELEVTVQEKVRAPSGGLIHEKLFQLFEDYLVYLKLHKRCGEAAIGFRGCLAVAAEAQENGPSHASLSSGLLIVE